MARLESIAMLAELDGAVLVDKPANMASHDVVKAVKQHFNLVKAGHGGTLEPNATGLFILLVGDGTRFAADLMGRDRAFTATVRLGRVTDTQDREGRTLAEASADGVTREALDAVLPEFRGDIFQTPPAFSTIKMTGHPGYDTVETPADERTARLVHVYRLVVTEFAPPLVTFDLFCTKGVCVRALAHDLMDVSLDGREMTCQAGVSLKEASEMACEMALSGLEFACGIPGTVGGACFMNAGAYGGCIADVLKEVTVLTGDGRFETLPVGELDLGYRHSRIADDDMIVVSATFALTPGDPAEIRATMDDLTEQRTSKQPLELPSAGSTFKRPEGYFAGKLISDAGLKGFQLGGAAVSSKHAGFVVNVGGATAADVCALIEHVQDEVERQFGVCLEPEVRMLGF